MESIGSNTEAGSNSLLPSILLHVMHNSSLLLVVQSRDLLEQWNIGQFQQQDLPSSWLAASAVGFLVSVLLIHYSQPTGRVAR